MSSGGDRVVLNIRIDSVQAKRGNENELSVFAVYHLLVVGLTLALSQRIH